MPPKKRKFIGQISPKAKKMKLLRKAETPEQRKVRLESSRIRSAEARASESIQQRAARLEADRIRQARSRASESIQKRAIRLEKDRLHHVQTRRKVLC